MRFTYQKRSTQKTAPVVSLKSEGHTPNKQEADIKDRTNEAFKPSKKQMDYVQQVLKRARKTAIHQATH